MCCAGLMSSFVRYMDLSRSVDRWKDGGLYLVDSSRNGTLLNNQQLSKDQEVCLKAGDLVTFGPKPEDLPDEALETPASYLVRRFEDLSLLMQELHGCREFQVPCCPIRNRGSSREEADRAAPAGLLALTAG